MSSASGRAPAGDAERDHDWAAMRVLLVFEPPAPTSLPEPLEAWLEATPRSCLTVACVLRPVRRLSTLAGVANVPVFGDLSAAMEHHAQKELLQLVEGVPPAVGTQHLLVDGWRAAPLAEATGDGRYDGIVIAGGAAGRRGARRLRAAAWRAGLWVLTNPGRKIG